MELLLTHGPGLILLLIGVLLLSAAIIGGGLEIKEIKIPKMEKTPRFLIAGLGSALTLCGGVMAFMAFTESLSPPSNQPEIVPTEISNNYIPNTNDLSVDKIRLPQQEGVSLDVQNEAAMLIVNADEAQILASFYQDESYLYPYYSGNALQQMIQFVEDIKQSGYIYLAEMDLESSYYVNMDLKNNILSIDQCEYWKSYWFDPDTGDLVSESEWALVPQTISIELVEDNAYITAISFYQNVAFCEE